MDASAMEVIERLRAQIEDGARELRDLLIPEGSTFAHKKAMTSAIRRIAPNGQANEIGWSCNVRSLRHMLKMRTSTAAEWEIRVVFNQVAGIIRDRWPLMLYGMEVTDAGDGLFVYDDPML